MVFKSSFFIKQTKVKNETLHISAVLDAYLKINFYVIKEGIKKSFYQIKEFFLHISNDLKMGQTPNKNFNILFQSEEFMGN